MQQLLFLVLVKIQSGSCCAVVSVFYKCKYITTELKMQKGILRTHFN